MTHIEVSSTPSAETNVPVSPFSPEGNELARIAKGMIGKFNRVGSTVAERELLNADLRNYIESTKPKEVVADLKHRLPDHTQEEKTD